MFASVVSEPNVTFSVGLPRLSQKGSARFKQINDSLYVVVQLFEQLATVDEPGTPM